MLLMISHGSFNPFVIWNKQAHIINASCVTLRYVFSHSSEPLMTFVNVLQFFSQKEKSF